MICRAIKQVVVNAGILYRAVQVDAMAKRWKGLDNWRRRCSNIEAMFAFSRNFALDLLRVRDAIVAAHLVAHDQAEQQTQQDAAGAASVGNPDICPEDVSYVKNNRKRVLVDLVSQFNSDPTFKRLRLASMITGCKHVIRSFGTRPVSAGSQNSDSKVYAKRKVCVLCGTQGRHYCSACEVSLCTTVLRGKDARSSTCWDKWHNNARLDLPPPPTPRKPKTSVYYF
jgi:hypothetical protein